MDFKIIVAVCLVIYFMIPVVLYFMIPKDPEINPRKRAIVLVLGDIGRSPRMQYHALSLIETGFVVDFCGYTETTPLQAIVENPDIKIHPIRPAEEMSFSRLPFALRAPLKAIYLSYQLYYLLKSLAGAEYLLVQNPPSLPTLLVSYLFITIQSRRTRFIIDWHNFGYTVLATKLQSDTHLFVRISKWYEKRFGRLSFANFCVTKSMADVLVRDFGLNSYRIIPLPDRPARQFKPLTSEARSRLLESSEIFTGFNPQTDKLIITSTSYTPDEDLNFLLDALSQYDVSGSPSANLPRILAIVTGKGPLQKDFLEEVKKRQWKNVTVRTVWLSAEEYPLVIGAADVGISMHLSTSGWDLPMKILDMFGCGVPVLARNFPALPELVREGRNGFTFNTVDELAKLMIEVFMSPQKLLQIRQGAKAESGNRWNETWRITAGPVFHIPSKDDLTEIYSSSSSDDEY
ncbi:Chitobiosyldiphosphodolichol beta-mannosyltransferase [Myxozyma melibiosi]|uniref:Chitobiosyldiphosphodolichol beta-mannosyltransferase n=1 Tax=Myxozyma melibiosi TaxID=54550 RepID=A0ABR1FAM8_9ASCO